MGNGTGQRPLSEVSPMAQRRNSPSWNQSTKKMAGESSPFDASPYTASSSPRLFWQGRDSGSPFQKSSETKTPYDPEAAYSPTKRASLENLKRVSRVKNSHIFAREQSQEYDPAHINVLHRPLATGRPFHNATESRETVVEQEKTAQEPTNAASAGSAMPRPPSPSKDQVSPAKSSLSKASRFGPKGAGFDPECEIWSDMDGRYRHAKSVTFDAAPPQVNEYEMTTPDPSSIASESREGSYDSEEDEGDISFDRDSLIDRDDSFDASLEDIEKTPVVLPEDWRFMNPSHANDELVHGEEDPFTEEEEEEEEDEEEDDVHTPDGRSCSPPGPIMQHSRVESLDSNGERRPLPPLPSSNNRPLFTGRSSSPGKLSAAFELGSNNSQRNLPTAPAPSAFSKADISELTQASMSLEERLRLMMLQERQDLDQISESGEQRTDQIANEPDVAQNPEQENEEEQSKPTIDDDKLEDILSPPRISRDSILRDLRKNDSYMDDLYDYSQLESSPHHDMHYDPDVPIPSLELDDDYDMENSVIIKEEEHDENLYGIPDYYDDHSEKGSIQENDSKTIDDYESEYSRDSKQDLHALSRDSNGSSDSQATPVPEEHPTTDNEAPSGVESHDDEGALKIAPLNMNAIRESLQRPVTPEDKGGNVCQDEPSTPESVIRHSLDKSDYSEEEGEEEEKAECVPDPVATVKAPGGALKTRPSLTPADIETMAANRRKVSGQLPPMPLLNKHLSNESSDASVDDDESAKESEDSAQPLPTLAAPARDTTQRQSSLVKLDIPFSIQEESLGFGLDKEFDRVIEAQKVAFELSLSQYRNRLSIPAIPHSQDSQIGVRDSAFPSTGQSNTDAYANVLLRRQRGYLMRHNTKVIIASSHTDDEPAPSGENSGDARGGRSAGSPSRKVSQQTWTTVPWNGQRRRSSIKMGPGMPKKKPVSGAVPPVPGLPSNVQEPAAPLEEPEPPLTETFEDGEERGRLFVKVVGLKYLDLPMPKGERSYFALTLDNGLHCVTTSWLELGKSAPIGQEFELIVQNDLEFQLTLQMKIDESKFRTPETVTSSPTRQKASPFSRVFASPKRRKELDLKNQVSQNKPKDVNSDVWDRLRNLVARDGSFARAYISLSDHEKHALGRPYTVDISCFNEWAVEDQPSSVKSKKSTSSMASQRRPPYKIGKLELQLLFVPKPKGAKEDDMPKSMNACIREMREAENVATRSWEGFLSQQGGDCPFWRRRFFKLQGSKLTAYHETTRQPRATINLAKAAKLIDDKSTLTQKETTTRGGGRRKSAFAEEEEGYMFVEEGFRIRFGNGEVIDFYADNAADKEGWMKVLGDAVGKSSVGNGQIKPWTELVLKHERALKSQREAADRLMGGNNSASSAPPARKEAAPPTSSTTTTAQAPQSPRARHKHTYSQPEIRSPEVRRQKARSLIF
ncbi:hypothetical protein ASPZODRAFT_56331 [Penicilliopsis zonata CBS 506.65]|uniref:PH domain-containing protein n=1 Tax=Penicilliopsis zonata CBS 506.65 TaxID=1073090 RepID=A0A1L9STS4_9EURO|nr:hypothetical protein ASPZODRAFT_56331 [Penicilliopsis zonata CBS 506.65]OJJ50524.1 hypothetical protein ASPZODRAFT_56331 [Penicilliopsis zonata CBS 506.65]